MIKGCVTGREIAAFLDKFTKDEIADMCQVVEKTVADAIQECNDKIQSVIQTYPEPFVMIGLKVDMIAEDDAIGKIAEVKIGSRREDARVHQ